MNYILGNCDVYLILTLHGNYIFHVSSRLIGKLLSHEIIETDVARVREEDFFSRTIVESSFFHDFLLVDDTNKKKRKRKWKKPRSTYYIYCYIKLMTNIARHSILRTLNVDKRSEQRRKERRKKEADRCPRDSDDSNR